MSKQDIVVEVLKGNDNLDCFAKGHTVQIGVELEEVYLKQLSFLRVDLISYAKETCYIKRLSRGSVSHS